MPSVIIEVRQQYSQETEVKIIDAVFSALVEHFKIFSHDRNVRLLVHEPHRFQCPPEKAFPELYTHISIDCFAGRSIDAKRNLYKGIVGNLSHLAFPQTI
ncbi:tautomerase family protein [Enterovibrio coralii]|uniref:tautomerase family protein n=1 Tax=Enterovibrio coralii TaxID=294935 RepID=UPI000B094D94|nr:tautomerase family protein [Enterovibrio coralii]